MFEFGPVGVTGLHNLHLDLTEVGRSFPQGALQFNSLSLNAPIDGLDIGAVDTTRGIKAEIQFDLAPPGEQPFGVHLTKARDRLDRLRFDVCSCLNTVGLQCRNACRADPIDIGSLDYEGIEEKVQLPLTHLTTEFI